MVGFHHLSVLQILLFFGAPCAAFSYRVISSFRFSFVYFKHIVLAFLSSRILFKDKDRNWEEIENKLRAESEVPIVKTSSMVRIVIFTD